MQLLLYQKYFCWQPTASKNKTCSVTNCFPIEDSLLPRGKVYSHKTPKVVDIVRRPSPKLHSTSNTFAPHLTILFDVREHVRKFLAFPRSAADNPPTVVRGPDPRCKQAASVADTQRAPWLIEQEKPRRLFVMSAALSCRWRCCGRPHLPPLLVAVALEHEMHPWHLRYCWGAATPIGAIGERMLPKNMRAKMAFQ